MGHVRTSLPQGMCNKFQEGACAGELLCSSLPCNWRAKKTSDLPNFLSCLLGSVIWIEGQGRHWMQRELCCALLFAAAWLKEQLSPQCWTCPCSTSFPPFDSEKRESHQIMLMKETPRSPTISVHQPHGQGCIWAVGQKWSAVCLAVSSQCLQMPYGPFHLHGLNFLPAGAGVQHRVLRTWVCRLVVHSQPGLGSSPSSHVSDRAYTCSKCSWKKLRCTILYW